MHTDKPANYVKQLNLCTCMQFCDICKPCSIQWTSHVVHGENCAFGNQHDLKVAIDPSV